MALLVGGFRWGFQEDDCAAGKACKHSLRKMGAWEARPVVDASAYRPGNAVATIGHSLIGPAARLGPMVTFGCLSCALEPPGGSGDSSCAPPPESASPSGMSVLMTDCLVHSGCSGGALVWMNEVCAASWVLQLD